MNLKMGLLIASSCLLSLCTTNPTSANEVEIIQILGENPSYMGTLEYQQVLFQCTEPDEPIITVETEYLVGVIYDWNEPYISVKGGPNDLNIVDARPYWQFPNHIPDLQCYLRLDVFSKNAVNDYWVSLYALAYWVVGTDPLDITKDRHDSISHVYKTWYVSVYE